jgi:hypothetical protein
MLRYAVLFNNNDILIEIGEEDFRKGLVEYDENAGVAFDKLHKELELAVRRK